MGSTSNSPIPIIDLAQFQSPDTSVVNEASKKLFEGMRDVGFVYLTNAPIPQSTITEAFSYSKKFFSLPTSTKMQAPHPPGFAHHRGYTPVGGEKSIQISDSTEDTNDNSPQGDFKESYEMGKDLSPDQPNIWLPPSTEAHHIPGFRPFFQNFYLQAHALELEVLRALALGLKIDKEYFTPLHLKMDNQTRILHYPSVAESLLTTGKGKRIAAHTDFGSITLLWQDPVGGLEVESPACSGNFFPAPYIPNTVLLNAGDFMQRWSNDMLRSTVHRVVAPPLKDGMNKVDGDNIDIERQSEERYSLVYFCGPDIDKVVDTVPSCWGPDKPKKYAPVTSGEYLAMRMKDLLGEA